MVVHRPKGEILSKVIDRHTPSHLTGQMSSGSVSFVCTTPQSRLLVRQMISQFDILRVEGDVSSERLCAFVCTLAQQQASERGVSDRSRRSVQYGTASGFSSCANGKADDPLPH